MHCGRKPRQANCPHYLRKLLPTAEVLRNFKSEISNDGEAQANFARTACQRLSAVVPGRTMFQLSHAWFVLLTTLSLPAAKFPRGFPQARWIAEPAAIFCLTSQELCPTMDRSSDAYLVALSALLRKLSYLRSVFVGLLCLPWEPHWRGLVEDNTDTELPLGEVLFSPTVFSMEQQHAEFTFTAFAPGFYAD